MTPESKSVTPTVFYRTINVEGLSISTAKPAPEMLPQFCSCTAFPRLLTCSAI